MRIGRHARRVLLRLRLPLGVLLPFWGFAHWVIQSGQDDRHRGDVGLGLALLLAALCVGLLVGYLVDVVLRIHRRENLLIAIDLLVLFLLSMPFGWVGCNWFGFVDHAICWLPVHGVGSLLGLLGL